MTSPAITPVVQMHDYPNIRETPRCMLCGNHAKPYRALMCWGCFNAGGSDGAFNSKLDVIESEINQKVSP